jgi:hypothetical protein
MEILRRLGKTPQQRGSLNNGTCPDIFELDTGDFAIIGTDMTDELAAELGAHVDPKRVVVITRETLIAARRDIPEQ